MNEADLKIGDEIEVMVLEVDAENRRLSLGHKQIEDNPWESYETIFSVDSVHEGVVGKVTDKGAVVTLPYGVEGFAPYRHLAKENGARFILTSSRSISARWTACARAVDRGCRWRCTWSPSCSIWSSTS